MIEWGKKSYAQVKLFDANEEVGSARVWGGDRWFVPLTGSGEVDVVLPRFPSGQKLRGEIVYQGPLKPPIKKGDQVAVLRVTSTVGGSPEPTAVTEAPLYAAADVEPSGFVWKGVDSLLHLAMRMVRL